jgi:hypothetical protein
MYFHQLMEKGKDICISSSTSMCTFEYYKDWPLNIDELTEIFCDYILSIDDPAQLE